MIKILSIRTQDRMALVPYKGRIIISIKDGEIDFDKELIYGTLMIVNQDGVYTTLGTYATKERALEVLDEIQQHVLGKVILQSPELAHMKTREEEILELPTVYIMPKE
jgi:hypothetical protein